MAHTSGFVTVSLTPQPMGGGPTCWLQINHTHAGLAATRDSKPVKCKAPLTGRRLCRSRRRQRYPWRREITRSMGTAEDTLMSLWKAVQCFSLRANFLFSLSRSRFSHFPFSRTVKEMLSLVFPRSAVVLSLISHMTGTGKEEPCVNKSSFSQSLRLAERLQHGRHYCTITSFHRWLDSNKERKGIYRKL